MINFMSLQYQFIPFYHLSLFLFTVLQKDISFIMADFLLQLCLKDITFEKRFLNMM